MPYFDHASTSFPKPSEVQTSIMEYLSGFCVSPGRGSHHLSIRANDWIEETRVELSHVLNVTPAHQIAFTQNATHSLNMVIKGFLRPKDHVLICQYSHNAALRPLIALKSIGVTYDIVPIDSEGNVNISAFFSFIKDSTRLLIATEASNVIGTIADFQEVYKECASRGIAVLIDSTQSLGYVSSNYADADFVVGTGHKTLLGPSGIGFAYFKNPLKVSTFMEGGSPGNSSMAGSHPYQMPYKFEAGTPNGLSISGLKGSLEYIKKIGWDEILKKSMRLVQFLASELQEIPNVLLYGTSDFEKKVPILSFNIKGLLPSQVAYELDTRHKICVRAGLHCAPLIHKGIGTNPSGTVRVSAGHLNTFEEIGLLLDAVRELSQEASRL